MKEKNVKFNHLEVFKVSLNIVYITSMMYVFGIAITTIIQHWQKSSQFHLFPRKSNMNE